jgi:hypothetical protein
VRGEVLEGYWRRLIESVADQTPYGAGRIEEAPPANQLRSSCPTEVDSGSVTPEDEGDD